MIVKERHGRHDEKLTRSNAVEHDLGWVATKMGFRVFDMMLKIACFTKDLGKLLRSNTSNCVLLDVTEDEGNCIKIFYVYEVVQRNGEIQGQYSMDGEQERAGGERYKEVTSGSLTCFSQYTAADRRSGSLCRRRRSHWCTPRGSRCERVKWRKKKGSWEG